MKQFSRKNSAVVKYFFYLACLQAVFINKTLANREHSAYVVSTAQPSTEQTITGKVVGEDGEPLTGATIQVKSLGIGAVTDINGSFSLTVPTDGDWVLVVSYIGYLSQEIAVKGNGALNLIVLKQNTSKLEEVVVVGYGTQRRKDITGAVSTVPTERLDMVPNLNIAQALQGAVPGVMIQQTQAGASPNQSILIRGRNSILASNDPLIVLDGIPYNGGIMDINPNDVKSIEVLKDASAAAIYGSRGANGVILITTKTGQTGKPSIAYEGRYATQQAVNVPKFMNGAEFYDFKQLREPGKVTVSEKAVYDSQNWVDWADLALHNGSSQQHNLSVAGGLQNVNYLINGSILDVDGVAINDGYRRITGRVNLDIDITKWLKIGTRTQFSNEVKRGFPLDWVVVLRKNPLLKAYDDSGNLTLYPWPEFIDIRNPLEPTNYEYSNESNQLISNNYALINFPFLKGLSYRFNSGVRKRFGDISNYIGRNTAAGLEARGIANTARNEEMNNVVENVLSYTKDIGAHRIFATAAYMFEENSASSNIVDARGFPNDFTRFYATSQATLISPSYTFNKTVLISQMLRLNYAYKGRYSLTLTGRRDGYSGFGANNKWGVFPSAAVAWNLQEEGFFPLKNQFSQLKLRASYGLNGNQAVGAYETISRYAENNTIAQGVTQPGYVPGKIGLENLGWESSRSFNVGLDFGMLQNRIEGDLNFYTTNTFDLLLNRSISSVNGFTSITQNIGETQNTGFELSLTSRNIVTDHFSWRTTANFSSMKDKIVALYGLIDENGKEINDVANAWFIGQPIRVNFNYAFEGVWQKEQAAEAAIWKSEPGNARINDLNKDGVINAEDRQIIGQLDPKVIWGLTNSFTFKNLTVSAFIHGVHGVTRLNELLQDASSGSEVRRNVLKKNWWTPDNPTNDFYRNALNAERMGGIAAPIYEDASFIRLKDLSLSYDFPSKLQEKIGLSKCRLYVVARNLVTITQWTGSDPELNHGRGANPLQREFVVGLNLNLQ